MIIENKEKFLSLCKEKIKREGTEPLLEWLEGTDFFTAPASTRFHGNYEGALCEHSLNVYEVTKTLTDKYYPEVSEESLILSTLFHDLCKVNFYKKAFKNVKNPDSGKWESKEAYEIDDSFPLGHGEKSCIMIQSFMKLNREELCAIRWHMSAYDNAVKGGDFSINKAYETYKLCPLLHAADLIAANIMEEKRA